MVGIGYALRRNGTLIVQSVTQKSPAYNKIFKDDVIFQVNNVNSGSGNEALAREFRQSKTLHVKLWRKEPSLPRLAD